MLDRNQEQERLRRLKEQQIRARNPKKKEQKFQQMSAARERKQDRSFSLGKAWRDIPHVWRYATVGFLLGVLTIVFLPRLWDSSWAMLAAFAATFVFTIFGGMVGNAVDVRENIKDLARR